jgi:hypothetical protein
MSKLDKLYTAYGELMVKQEILQNQINAVKREINGELRNLPPQEDSDEDKKAEDE